jgi:hypothetical protein
MCQSGCWMEWIEPHASFFAETKAMEQKRSTERTTHSNADDDVDEPLGMLSRSPWTSVCSGWNYRWRASPVHPNLGINTTTMPGRDMVAIWFMSFVMFAYGAVAPCKFDHQPCIHSFIRHSFVTTWTTRTACRRRSLSRWWSIRRAKLHLLRCDHQYCTSKTDPGVTPGGIVTIISCCVTGLVTCNWLTGGKAPCRGTWTRKRRAGTTTGAARGVISL